jgi:hypothetical protein
VKALEQFVDNYDRKARLYPSLLLIAPLIAVIVAAVSTKYSVLQTVAMGIISCGGAFLLTQFARDAGKKLEPKLLQAWGGLSSIVIFRHRDNRFDAITKARYHKAMVSLVEHTKAPSQVREQENPTAADEVYAAWSNYLRTHTRDQKRFSLLFKENINYGYRRNVVGLRAIGISISALALLIAIARVYSLYSHSGEIDSVMAAAGAFSFVLLLLWIFRFSPNWVRIPADAYAYRLIEAIDLLPTARTPKK